MRPRRLDRFPEQDLETSKINTRYRKHEALQNCRASFYLPMKFTQRKSVEPARDRKSVGILISGPTLGVSAEFSLTHDMAPHMRSSDTLVTILEKTISCLFKPEPSSSCLG